MLIFAPTGQDKPEASHQGCPARLSATNLIITDTMDLFTIFGSLAAICMVLGYLPQAIYTIRTRDTDGIALPTFLLMGLGSAFFVVQGCLSHPLNWPLIATNLITFICSAIVFGIKMYNDHFRRKK